MKLYALKIRKSDLELITLLNQGVVPQIEKKITYFIFDAEWNSEVPNEIVTETEFNKRFKSNLYSPKLLALIPR